MVMNGDDLFKSYLFNTPFLFMDLLMSRCKPSDFGVPYVPRQEPSWSQSGTAPWATESQFEASGTWSSDVFCSCIHVFSCLFMCFSYVFFCVWLFSGWLQNCHVTNSKKLRESTNLRFQKGPKNPTARQIIGISGKSFHLHPHLNQESPGQGQTLVFDQGSQGWPWRMEKNCEKKNSSST